MSDNTPILEESVDDTMTATVVEAPSQALQPRQSTSLALKGEEELQLEKILRGSSKSSFPSGFIPKIFPISVPVSGLVPKEQMMSLRENLASTLLDLIENRVIDLERRNGDGLLTVRWYWDYVLPCIVHRLYSCPIDNNMVLEILLVRRGKVVNVITVHHTEAVDPKLYMTTFLTLPRTKDTWDVAWNEAQGEWSVNNKFQRQLKIFKHKFTHMISSGVLYVTHTGLSKFGKNSNRKLLAHGNPRATKTRM